MRDNPQEKLQDNPRVQLAGAALFLTACAAAVLFIVAAERPAARAERRVETTLARGVKEAKTLIKRGLWAKAVTRLEPLAAGGDPAARFHLGRLYAAGRGAPLDLESARRLLRSVVETSSPLRGAAAFELSKLYRRASGPNCDALALAWAEQALSWGYAKAHLLLAKHHERAAPADLAKAVAHYRAAARHGLEQAALPLAALLAKGGRGLSRDPMEAEALGAAAIAALRRDAEGGKASAAKHLARAYRDGRFVARDEARALTWYRRASQLGDPGAMHDLGLLLLTRARTPAAAAAALGWLRRATQLGHGGAMTALGRLHLAKKHGLVRADAVAWLERGVAANHGGAMEELARLKAAGDLVPQDAAGARALAARGAALGHRGAKALLDALNAADDPKTNG